MFGYIVINEPELRIRELDLYRSYYCGLCEDLHYYYGRSGQLMLSYDTTFLGFLLSCLYEPEDEKKTRYYELPETPAFKFLLKIDDEPCAGMAYHVMDAETGAKIYALDPLASGELSPDAYETGMLANAEALLKAFQK